MNKTCYVPVVIYGLDLKFIEVIAIFIQIVVNLTWLKIPRHIRWQGKPSQMLCLFVTQSNDALPRCGLDPIK